MSAHDDTVIPLPKVGEIRVKLPQAPDDAAVAAIRHEYEQPRTVSWQWVEHTSPSSVAARIEDAEDASRTLLAALDAARARCAEVQKEWDAWALAHREWVVERAKLLAERDTAAARARELEKALRSHGYHEPGKCEQVGHGMSHWLGDHCAYDEPALARYPREEEQK